MIKDNLLDMGFSEQHIYPNAKIINGLWAALFWIINILTFIVLTLIRKDMDIMDREDPLKDIHIFLYGGFDVIGIGNLIFVFYFILLLFMYFAVKCMLTVLFCKDKDSIKKDKGSTKFLFLKDYSKMPVCFCREAQKTWQIVLVYLIPFASIYAPMFYLAYKVGGAGRGVYTVLLFILLFIMSFDLLPVIYVLIAKLRYGMDYISIDCHVYEMTLYRNTHKPNKRTKKVIQKK